MLVVADTSPLNYLVWIESVEILPKLYGQVLIPSILLIDERAGSEMARSLGLRVTGTLGVLDEAARRKLISLPEAIERLKRTSFRYPKAVIARLIEEDARRS